MAKSRIVDTIFWEDNYTANLDPTEKLLFLYFLTNGSTNICGIYQITLKKVAVETGFEKDMVEKILCRFERDDKIFYREGWLGIKNFIKHQNQNSPQVKKGIERELELVPKSLKSIVFGEGIDTLSHLTKPNLTKPNEAHSADKPRKKVEFTKLGAEVLKLFEEVDPKNKLYYANTTQRKACEFLLEEYGIENVKKAIKILPQINRKKLFIGQVTTPVELINKWVKIAGALAQEKTPKVLIV